MKHIAFFLFIIGVSMNANANQTTREQHQIQSTIESFATLVDQSAFEYLGTLFYKQVDLDYTSLFGGTPNVVTNVDLMRQWAGLVPGFDFTHHQLSNIQINQQANYASASANVTASHYLGDNGLWEVSGLYQFELIKEGNYWKIKGLTLLSESESGSRAILEEATKYAKARLHDKHLRLVSYLP